MLRKKQKVTFQLLLFTPSGKFCPHFVDKTNQNLSALAEMLHTVPRPYWSVSASLWVPVNLQKYKENGSNRCTSTRTRESLL